MLRYCFYIKCDPLYTSLNLVTWHFIIKVPNSSRVIIKLEVTIKVESYLFHRQSFVFYPIICTGRTNRRKCTFSKTHIYKKKGLLHLMEVDNTTQIEQEIVQHNIYIYRRTFLYSVFTGKTFAKFSRGNPTFL